MVPIKDGMFALEFEGLPLTVNRMYWHGKHGRRFLLPAGRRYKNNIRIQCLGKNLEIPPPEGFYRVIYDFYINNMRATDISNRVKSLEDALSGLIYPDDKDVWKIEINRYLGKPEKTVVKWEVFNEAPTPKGEG